MFVAFDEVGEPPWEQVALLGRPDSLAVFDEYDQGVRGNVGIRAVR